MFLANKNTQIGRFVFHQVFDATSLLHGATPAFHVASASAHEPDESTQKSRTSAGATAIAATLFDVLTGAGVGRVSVVEASISLRMLGDDAALADLTSLMGAGEQATHAGTDDTDDTSTSAGHERMRGRSPSDPGPDPSMWPWVHADATNPSAAMALKTRVDAALEIAMAQIRRWQRDMFALRRTPAPLATVERLPPLIPMRVHRGQGPFTETEPTVLVVNDTLERTPQPDLTEAEFSHLRQARSITDAGPFSAYLDVQREAIVAVRRLGDYRLGAMLYGIAAESLFDELLLHLMWEEGLTPEQVAQDWIEGAATRVVKKFPSRLGGSWDLSGRGPVAQWSQNVAALRHRVAHAAYIPTRDEIATSADTADALVTHLCDRLAHTSVLRRYPRTAVTLAGQSGLQRRNAYTRRIRDLEADAAEVNWTETFSRWRESWRRCRQRQLAPDAPDASTANLLAVVHPDRSVRWCLHHRHTHLAAPVGVDLATLPGPARDSLLRLVASIVTDETPDPISISVENMTSHPQHVDLTWVEEYQLVPMTQVMVDRTDYA